MSLFKFKNFPQLTKREREIAQVFAFCSGAKEAGKRLGISHLTVEYYWRQIRLKLGEQDTYKAIHKAQAVGLLD